MITFSIHFLMISQDAFEYMKQFRSDDKWKDITDYDEMREAIKTFHDLGIQNSVKWVAICYLCDMAPFTDFDKFQSIINKRYPYIEFQKRDRRKQRGRYI